VKHLKLHNVDVDKWAKVETVMQNYKALNTNVPRSCKYGKMATDEKVEASPYIVDLDEGTKAGPKTKCYYAPAFATLALSAAVSA
jgi:hypothetical protein